MICVSYTRSTSCNRLDAPVYSIAEQNEHIRQFAKANGFSIQKKYSDRTTDPECVAEFERMRIDGLNRNFDMLVFDSFWQCGKDILTIVRVLKNSFYPAGIQFAIVQEDFCSAGRERNEVMQYLDSVREKYMSHLAEAHMNGNPHMFYVETFGFRYNSEKDVLEIDEESAGVVREIFSKLLTGSTPSEIARELTEQGAEKPGDYMCRIKGWPLRGNNRGWTEGSVYSIAKNPKFAGRWQKIDNGKNYADDCEAIVDPEMFDKVQKLFDQRRHQNICGKKQNNPFLKMLTDEETGAKVIMKKNQQTGIYDFHFQYPKPAGVSYDRTCMDYQEAIDQIRAELKKEHEKALSAAEQLGSDQILLWKRHLLEETRASLTSLLKDFMQYSGEKIMLNANCEAGMIPEPKYRIGSMTAEIKCRNVTDELTNLYEKIVEIEKCFSSDNPWIKLFSEYDEDHELTRGYLRKFCEHVHIWQFEKIKPVFREVEWRNKLLNT